MAVSTKLKKYKDNVSYIRYLLRTECRDSQKGQFLRKEVDKGWLIIWNLVSDNAIIARNPNNGYLRVRKNSLYLRALAETRKVIVSESLDEYRREFYSSKVGPYKTFFTENAICRIDEAASLGGKIKVRVDLGKIPDYREKIYRRIQSNYPIDSPIGAMLYELYFNVDVASSRYLTIQLDDTQATGKGSGEEWVVTP